MMVHPRKPSVLALDQVDVRRSYLREVEVKYGGLDLHPIGSASLESIVKDVFVDLPVPIWLSVRVADGSIVEHAITLEQGGIQHPLQGGVESQAIRLEDSAGTRLFESLQGELARSIASRSAGASTRSNRSFLEAPLWDDGIKYRARRIYVTEILSVRPRTVLVGPPGAGKSTVLKYLAVSSSSLQLRHVADGSLLRRELPWYARLTPVLFRFSEFVRWRGTHGANSSFSEAEFWKFYVSQWSGNCDGVAMDSVRRELVEGRGLILVDGLDEVAERQGSAAERVRQREISELAQLFCGAYGESHVLFSSREHGYRDWSIPRFDRLQLAPLTTSDRRVLFERATAATASAERGARISEFFSALEGVPTELQERPLFVVLMAMLFDTRDSRSFPQTGGRLYRECIDLLLSRWTSYRDGISLADHLGCTREDLLERLAFIAYDAQVRVGSGEGDLSIDEDTIVRVLFRLEGGGRRTSATQALEYLVHHVGLLISPSATSYAFLHRGFQEYLAAVQLAELSKAEGYSLIAKQLMDAPNVWRESCLMLEDVCREEDSRWAMVQSLLGVFERRDDHRRAWPLWLATRLAMQLSLRGRRRESYHKGVLRGLAVAAAEVLEGSCELPLAERCDLVDTQSGIADLRSGVGLREGIPDIAWCEIPTGVHQVGLSRAMEDMCRSCDWGIEWDYERERRSETVSAIRVPSYKISRFPITVSQFDAFVRAGGYNENRFWSAEGKRWREGAGIVAPGEQRWGGCGSLPVTNVSWYEAEAFCSWLSRQLTLRVRLPTAVEWERAARGEDDRLFPWGNEFDRFRSNGDLTGLGRVCPVGMFPSDGPWGDASPRDLAGNVWEWCGDLAPESEATPGVETEVPVGTRPRVIFRERMRVTRGGAYLSAPLLLRTTFWGRDRPSARYSRQGFRVVGVPMIPPEGEVR